MSENLQKLRDAKAKLEEQKRAKALELEEKTLELELKYESELGPRGVFFEVVDTIEGPVVIKLGEAILHKRFSESKVTPTDVHDYVTPCVVHPSREEYLQLVDRRPAIEMRCATALAALYGAKRQADEGKF